MPGGSVCYLAMSAALRALRRCSPASRVARAIRWLFVGGFVSVVTAFVAFNVIGHDLVAFEVSALSINWIVLIASGALLAVLFRHGPVTMT